MFCHLQLNLSILRGISPGILVENKSARNHRGVSPGILIMLEQQSILLGEVVAWLFYPIEIEIK